jgi:Flp pilus assembly pilin Flp
LQQALMELWCDCVGRWLEVTTQERGATAVEYGIMLALIAGILFLIVQALGLKTSGAFADVGSLPW